MNSLIKEIEEIREECSIDNWDGYGAKPIPEHTIQKALIFIEKLNGIKNIPEVSCGPSQIIFDWVYEGNRLAFEISEKEEIAYCILGVNKCKGKIQMDSVLEIYKKYEEGNVYE